METVTSTEGSLELGKDDAVGVEVSGPRPSSKALELEQVGGSVTNEATRTVLVLDGDSNPTESSRVVSGLGTSGGLGLDIVTESTASKFSVEHAALHEDVVRFEVQRAKDRKKDFHRVAGLGTALIAFGAAMLTVHLVQAEMRTRGVISARASVDLGTVFSTTASIFLTLGVIVLTTSPLDELDVDAILATFPKCCFWFWALRVGIDISLPYMVSRVYGGHGVEPLHWARYCMFFVDACGLASSALVLASGKPSQSRKWCNFLPCQSSLLALSALLSNLVRSMLVVYDFTSYAMYSCSAWLADDEFDTASNVANGVLVVSSALVQSCVCRERYLHFNERGGLSPTLSLHYTLYASLGIAGAVSIGVAVEVRMTLLGEGCAVLTQSVAVIVCGLAQLLPILLVSVVSRDDLFGLMAKRFERDPYRKQRDGAFMASLLDRVTIQKGEDWWVHHGRNDPRFGTFDPRRNWHRGKVVRIRSDSFLVKIPKGQSRSPRFGRRTAMDRRMSDFASDMFDRVVSVQSFSEAHSCIISITSTISGGEHVSGSSLKWLPLASRGTPVDKLLHMAQDNLRCVDWSSLSLDVMSGAICGNAEATDLAAWFALSRKTKRNEVVDCFISHSWYDDANLKWEKLTEYADNFNRKCGRYPTFWLDKACIDQDQLADGLKALPVHVMACREVLVLCGDTYATRLWCAWELCTVFAFARSDAATRERARLIPIGADSGSSALSALTRFKVSEAYCYDPNEQARLMRVICAVGEDRFNERIRKFADVLVQRRRRLCKSGSGSSVVTESEGSETSTW